MSVSPDSPPAKEPSSAAAFEFADTPTAALPATEDLLAQAQDTPSSLPVPIGPLRSQLSLPREEPKEDQARPSFWRRIKMRRRGAEAPGPGSGEETAFRLTAIERQLEQRDESLQAQLETLNGRLDEVWQSEEQLSHLADIQEKLDRLAQQQASLTRSVVGLKRILGWLAVLVVVAAAGAEIALEFVM